MNIQDAIANVKTNPQNPDAWVALGDAMAETGQADKARDSFERALKLAPGHGGALAGLARLEAGTVPDWLDEVEAEAPTAGPPANVPSWLQPPEQAGRQVSEQAELRRTPQLSPLQESPVATPPATRPITNRATEVPASPVVKAGGGALGALGWLVRGWLGIYRRLEGLPLAMFLGANLCGVCFCMLMVIGLFSDREGRAVAVGATATATNTRAPTITLPPSATRAPTRTRTPTGTPGPSQTPTAAPPTNTPRPTDTPGPSPTRRGTNTPEAGAVPAGPSDESLTTWGRIRFGDDFKEANFTIDIAVIDYKLPDVWDDEGLMIAATDNFRRLAPEVFRMGPQVQWVRFRSTTVFVDQYGKTSEGFALGLLMPRVLFEKVEWENTTSRRLAALMDSEADGATVYVHPALREAWAGYAGE